MFLGQSLLLESNALEAAVRVLTPRAAANYAGSAVLPFFLHPTPCPDPVARFRSTTHRSRDTSGATHVNDRVWQVPRDQFLAAWNEASSLQDATARLHQLAGVKVPGWAMMARAAALRKDGVEMKVLVREPRPASVPA